MTLSLRDVKSCLKWRTKKTVAAILSAATIIKEVDLALSGEDQVEAVLKEVVA